MTMQKFEEKWGGYCASIRNYETPDGWFVLVDGLMEEISKILPEKTLNIEQIKSKFASLRFYCYCDVAYDSLMPKIDDLIREAELKSAKTCEVCGAEAEAYSSGSWLFTLCEKHKEQHMRLLRR